MIHDEPIYVDRETDTFLYQGFYSIKKTPWKHTIVCRIGPAGTTKWKPSTEFLAKLEESKEFEQKLNTRTTHAPNKNAVEVVPIETALDRKNMELAKTMDQRLKALRKSEARTQLLKALLKEQPRAAKQLKKILQQSNVVPILLRRHIGNTPSFVASVLQQIDLGGLSVEHREQAYRGVIVALAKDLGQTDLGFRFASLVEHQACGHEHLVLLVKIIQYRTVRVYTPQRPHDSGPRIDPNAPLYCKVRSVLAKWRENGASHELMQAIKYGVRPKCRWITIPEVDEAMIQAEILRLKQGRSIRRCQGGNLVHSAFMIPKSDGKRGRLILNPESINAHAQKKTYQTEGLEKLAHVARSGDVAMSADIKDGFYALAVANPRIWQFCDHRHQLWCFSGKHKRS
ncbi:hypothetical protein SARC_08637, partial [Sphaeroforma arctica JP610]